MTAPATLLRLMWLASPALPVGGFSYSEGLEAAIEAGRVQGESAVGDWLLDQLHLSLARADLPVCALAFQAWQIQPTQQLAPNTAYLQDLNDWVLATRESAEFRLQTEQMGRSLVEWLRNGEHGADPRVACCAGLAPAPSWPVAFALACALAFAPGSETAPAADDEAHHAAEAEQALLALAFGWAENMTQAALKSVPLGQSSGQRMLAALARAIPEAVHIALSRTDDTRQAFSPMLAILSSRHETQYSRLFRS